MQAPGAKDVRKGFLFFRPDTYELGQANQAVRILVNAVNAVGGMGAERAFLPAVDMCRRSCARRACRCSPWRAAAPVADFDVVGITLPHELAATNVLETLDLRRHPAAHGRPRRGRPHRARRRPVRLQPGALRAVLRRHLGGRGRGAAARALALIRELRAAGAPRAEILRAVARRVGGAYVPSLYRVRAARPRRRRPAAGRSPLVDGVPAVVEKRVFEGFADSPALGAHAWCPIREVVHDRLNVEMLRGCARGCRFCQAGMMYRPVRERSADNIVDAVARGLAETGYDEVSLTSLSSTDHSQIAADPARG